MYCTECGARLEEGALFCCECGNKVEQPADAECMTEAEKPVTHPEPPPVPQREQTASTAPKKPMSRKKKKALIIAGAIIAFIILGSVVMRSVFTPERLVEKFIDAMEYGDYGVLTAVACPRSDKTGLTEETAEALFALYNGNGAYRNAIEETLENQAYLLKHGKKINVEEEWEPLFSIKSTDFLLFSLYKVEIGEVELDIYTSFPNSKVTVLGKTEISYPQSYSDYRASGESDYGYTDEALNPAESTAHFEHLLPGKYDVKVEYLSSLGQEFVAETSVEAGAIFGNEGYAYIEYCTFDVYNNTELEATITVGDGQPVTVSPYSGYFLTPLLDGTDIEIACTSDDGQDFGASLVAGVDIYYEISCIGAHLYDYTGLVDSIYINGQKYGYQLSDGSDDIYLYPIAPGSLIEAAPADSNMFEAFTCVPESDGDTYYVEFKLTEEAEDQIKSLIEEDVDAAAVLLEARTSDELFAAEDIENQTIWYLYSYFNSDDNDVQHAVGSTTLDFSVMDEYGAYILNNTIGENTLVEVSADVTFQIDSAYSDGASSTENDTLTVWYNFQYENGEFKAINLY